MLQIFSKDLRYFSKILQNTKDIDNLLQLAAILAKFYEYRVENDGFEQKLSKRLQNHENIQKINCVKDCKFEFGAGQKVQRNANLVDLENP